MEYVRWNNNNCAQYKVIKPQVFFSHLFTILSHFTIHLQATLLKNNNQQPNQIRVVLTIKFKKMAMVFSRRRRDLILYAKQQQKS